MNKYITTKYNVGDFVKARVCGDLVFGRVKEVRFTFKGITGIPPFGYGAKDEEDVRYIVQCFRLMSGRIDCSTVYRVEHELEFCSEEEIAEGMMVYLPNVKQLDKENTKC